MPEGSTTADKQTSLFDSREQCASLLVELVKQAKRRVCFFAPTLDPLLDDTAITQLLSQFSRSSEKARVQVLVHDSQSAIASGHRLITLAQKLSSSISIHRTAQQHKESTQLFMLIDDKGYLYCPHHNQYQGRVSMDNASETRQLQQTFDIMWEQSVTDSSLRRLHI